MFEFQAMSMQRMPASTVTAEFVRTALVIVVAIIGVAARAPATQGFVL
jgi:hypothetical protein